MVLADRGYDADWIRALVNEQGAWANIPPKRNRKHPICFSPHNIVRATAIPSTHHYTRVAGPRFEGLWK